jgi:hypothetical protein
MTARPARQDASARSPFTGRHVHELLGLALSDRGPRPLFDDDRSTSRKPSAPAPRPWPKNSPPTGRAGHNAEHAAASTRNSWPAIAARASRCPSWTGISPGTA